MLLFSSALELDPSSTTVVWSFGAALAPIDPAPAHQPLQLFRAPFQLVGVQLPLRYTKSTLLPKLVLASAPQFFFADATNYANLLSLVSRGDPLGLLSLSVVYMLLMVLHSSAEWPCGSRAPSSGGPPAKL
ncbi:hypothetical protein C8R47DRAFT_1212756 [Mycena vitilis]|nr:hypothetical protein C8R47DRAFT_1212756 [Mycena vitilis]